MSGRIVETLRSSTSSLTAQRLYGFWGIGNFFVFLWSEIKK